MRETIDFVRLVAHPAVGINFDIGSLYMNGEMSAAGDWFARADPFVSHVHVSEPNLAPAPQDVAAFEALSRDLIAQGYDGWFSIEMRAAGEDNLGSIEKAVVTCSRALAAASQCRV
jgi:sugar phosphate isomerase/epimerase